MHRTSPVAGAHQISPAGPNQRVACSDSGALVLAALAAWLTVSIVSLVTGPPLGHDEAAFAVAARGDAPAWLYRSLGVREIARVGVTLGGANWALRLTPLVLGTSIVM